MVLSNTLFTVVALLYLLSVAMGSTNIYNMKKKNKQKSSTTHDASSIETPHSVEDPVDGDPQRLLAEAPSFLPSSFPTQTANQSVAPSVERVTQTCRSQRTMGLDYY